MANKENPQDVELRPRRWRRYRAYFTHMKKFMLASDLFPASGRAYVAVSGGLDSMALLTLLNDFKKAGFIRDLYAIHINHGTRQECLEDVLLVTGYCRALGIPLIVETLSLSLRQNNFEERARQQRYALFAKMSGAQDVVYTAHHIDDSFEWGLLQQFKSSQGHGVLGIPVKRGVFRRPFLCLTRGQLETLVHALQIPFRRDQSNDDPRFARNYLRKNIIPAIKSRFPKYLKHYVARANLQAQERQLSAFTVAPAEVRVYRDSLGGLVIINTQFHNQFFQQEEKILQGIQELSSARRGTLSKQIQKLMAAAAQGKKGPFIFSGGVYGLMERGMLYFHTKKLFTLCAELDKKLLQMLKTGSQQGLDKILLRQKDDFGALPFAQMAFPFLCFNGEEKRHNKGSCLRTPHFLWPRATEYALQHGIPVQTLGKYFASAGNVANRSAWVPLFSS